MGLFDFLGKWLGKVKINSNQTVVIDIPPSLFYKELALYTAESLIANAISLSEFRVYANHEPVKNKDYYLLNIAPNKNENSNYFWHKVIKKMIREPTGAMVVEINGELHCAEQFSIKQERPILGNLYDGVVLEGGLQLGKVFSAQEVYHFRMEDIPAKTFIDGVHEDYGTLLKSAARAFKDTNGRKFKLKVDSIKAGDEEFAAEFSETISKEIKAYMENEYATYVEYDGEELVEESNNKSAKSIDDFVKLRQDMFQMVAQALKIPQSLMAGNITSLKEVSDVFLTFAVDPYADCITATLNKRATALEYCQGNYYKCYTGTVKHKDIFNLAPAVDKLIASSVVCTDEARVEIGLQPLNTPWSKRHVRTKNYEDVEKNTMAVEEGEE